MIDQHVTNRTQLALIACLAQDPRGRIAAAIAEHREVHFDQLDPAEMRDQVTCIVTGFKPDRGGVGLFAKGIDRDTGIGDRLVIAETELDFSHRSPP